MQPINIHKVDFRKNLHFILYWGGGPIDVGLLRDINTNATLLWVRVFCEMNVL